MPGHYGESKYGETPYAGPTGAPLTAYSHYGEAKYGETLYSAPLAPPPPPPPLVVIAAGGPVAAYRFRTVNFKTGARIGEFPLENVTFTRQLATVGAGEWKATLPLTDEVLQLDPIAGTVPNLVALVVERNEQILYAGMLLDRDYDDVNNALLLGGRETWAYFDRRFVGSDVTYTGIDQGLIVRDLLATAALEPDGDIGLDLPATMFMVTGVARTAAWLSSEVKPIGEAIVELARMDGGFEFYIEPYWSDRLLRHRLVFAYPQAGVSALEAGPVRWSKPAGTIIKYSWPETGASTANEVFAIGDDGNGGVRLQRVKQLPGDYPLLQTSTSWRDVKDAPGLLAHAISDLARVALDTVIPKVQVTGDGPPELGTYALGDDALFEIADPRLSALTVARIYGWTVTVPEGGKQETVDLLLGPMMPTNIEALVGMLDEQIRRVRILEARAGALSAADQLRLLNLETVTGAPPAPTPTQTIVLLNLSHGAQIFTGNADIMSGSWTPPRAGGSVVIEGQLDCNANYWDNYVAAPGRRDVKTVSDVGSSAAVELPSPSSGSGQGPRITVTRRDTFSGIALAAHTSKWSLLIKPTNQIHVYSGWLRATWTG